MADDLISTYATCDDCGSGARIRLDRRLVELLALAVDELGIDTSTRAMTHQCRCGNIYPIELWRLANERVLV